MLLGQICISQGFYYELDVLRALGRQSLGDLRKLGEILLDLKAISRMELDRAHQTQKMGRKDPIRIVA